MKIFTCKNNISSNKAIVVDDMFLTTDMPTTAGSKMLDNYKSLFEAEVISRLKSNGYDILGKADVGEFAIDLLGETSYNGTISSDGVLVNASAEILKTENVLATLNLDVNGAPRRAAAINGLVSIKPTYGTVSRFGTIPVACSGETVSVTAKSVSDLKEVLYSIIGHDDKDGTSLSEETCLKVKNSTPNLKKKVAILKSMLKGDESVLQSIQNFKSLLTQNGFEVVEVDDEVIKNSYIAWNILMASELCNNVSKYDGVKYGYRTQNFTNIDELYTNSRTEAFGDLLKTIILFGSDNLSTENYMKVYDKALRVRRVILEKFKNLFESFDGVILPCSSKSKYTIEDIKNDKYLAFKENYYTAPASITGLPAIVVGGVQIVGNSFTENTLLSIANLYEKGVK